MKSKQEVEKFLEEIRVKVISGVKCLLYLNDREKNAQALLDLEIAPNKRTEIIMALKPEDFYRIEEGRFHDLFEMYSFGKMVKGIEIYIKNSVLYEILWVVKFEFATGKVNHVNKIPGVSITPCSFFSQLNF